MPHHHHHPHHDHRSDPTRDPFEALRDFARFAGRRRSRGGGRGGEGGPGFPPGGPAGFPPGPGGFPPGGPGGFPPGGGGFPFGGMPWALWGMLRRGGPGGPGGGGGRARRGDVRAAILSLLAEQPRNGYQIMRELEQRSGGAWRPSPGSVYPSLQQLEDEGLVREEQSGVAPGGRVFGLTDAGRAYVKEHKEELAAAWESVSPVEQDGNLVAMITQVRHIAGAAMQVLHAGTPAQIAEAQKILAGARRALYGLLAAGGDDDEDGEGGR